MTVQVMRGGQSPSFPEAVPASATEQHGQVDPPTTLVSLVSGPGADVDGGVIGVGMGACLA